jgi:serine/threonine protein kinase/tetratricopeptide (TPR) repeat protein
MNIGEQLGAYLILEIIGEGGMGQVFLAEDLHNQEQVAIKLLRRELLASDPTMLERLRREGEALRRLNHPNIVQMLEVLETEQDYAIVLEYVGGGDLTELIHQDELLPTGFILRLALELADALARAHHLKIIHRDLKPANIMMAADGTPRLTDFGVARMANEATMTQAGEVVGSLPYLSPEMIHGETVDLRADIWAFGVILYEMLSGKRLFLGQTAAETMMKIISYTQPPVDILALRPDCPPEVLVLMNHMLQTNPQQRIESMRRVGAELESILRDHAFEDTDLPAHFRRNAGTTRFDSPSAITPSRSNQSRSRTGKTATGSSRTSRTAILSEAAPAQKSALARAWPLAAVALLILGGAAFLMAGGGAEEGGGSDPAAISQVAPVEPGNFMVLLAPLEAIGPARPEVDRQLLETLQEEIEQGSSLTQAQVRAYPGIITTAEQAAAVAEANQATIILWGNYNADLIEVNIQIGYLPPDRQAISLPPDIVRETGNVRLQLTDPRRESLAEHVLNSLFVYHSGLSNIYAGGAIFVALEDLQVQGPEITGVTVGAQVHRWIALLASDPQASLGPLEEALRVRPQSPFIYHFRVLSYNRLGQVRAANESANTAIRLGGPSWTVPYIALATNALDARDYPTMITHLTLHLEVQPSDWFMRTVRGLGYYFNGEYDLARQDFELAIAGDPQISLPHAFAVLLAMRQGQVEEAQALMQEIQTFSDPTILTRLVLSYLGPNNQTSVMVGHMMATFSNILLGQYQGATQEIEQAAALEDPFPEVFLLQGLVACLLEDPAAAEVAYTQGLELDPDFTLLYLLRADGRNRENNLAGALQDLGAAQETAAWPSFEALAMEVLSGAEDALNCQSFFTPPATE